MYSVTQRARMIKQPKGGYLNPNDMNCEIFENEELANEENLPAYIVGLVVDYLSRYCVNHDIEKSFEISLMGAKISNKENEANILLEKINESLDNESIISACELVKYDAYLRGGVLDSFPIADASTIENIRKMIRRSMAFFEKYGPILLDGFTFSGGYTKLVSSGDGDFLTKNALWDFKVLRSEPTMVHTLQLLMYYYMGKNSNNDAFNHLNTIGIFNPRLNKVYTYDVRNLDKKIIDKIQYEVIGYKKKRIK